MRESLQAAVSKAVKKPEVEVEAAYHGKEKKALPWDLILALALGSTTFITVQSRFMLVSCMYMEDMELNVRSYCEYSGLKFGVRGYVD